MASYTTPSESELGQWLQPYEIGGFEALFGVAGGSVNSNFDVRAGGHRYFLPIYEEQDQPGAQADAELAARLAMAGVLTPAPLARNDGTLVSALAEKPAALLAWVDGNMKCQSSVSAAVARTVGAELAKVHTAGLDAWARPSRFGATALFKRIDELQADPRFGEVAPGLREALRDCERDPGLPAGLIHGDLFRDNVLWKDARVVALLDFESASIGPYVYDLAVTLLAWCFGDSLEPNLVSALVAGYESVRPLAPTERDGIYEEARFAALRFTITRITDYAIRGGSGGARVMKDWRRFERRKQLLDEMGSDGLVKMMWP